MTGITNEEGQIYQSYRYSAFGEITFGAPEYENEYTYNGESYNPNIESQYLRARYYDVVTATFITEDFYPQDMWSLWNITAPLTLNRYNYCVSSPLNYVDPSGHTQREIWENLITDYATSIDLYGMEIGLWYLYGNGEDFVVEADDNINTLQTRGYSWKDYMEANDILEGKVGDVVIPIGTNLSNNESIEIDMTFSMIIQNGEGASGYEFMHGTNAEVGGFHIEGNISKDVKGTIIYDLEYTWNDVMDPFPEAYASDAQKAEIAKTIPFANPQDYNFHVSWRDKTIIYEKESLFKHNSGWLKDWDSEWVSNLSEIDSIAYDWIDYEQINYFGFLSWKEYVEKIMEEYSEYYDC